MIVVIDNYDSFVLNLARYLERLGQPIAVLRNDAATVPEILALEPRALVLSPGPCGPKEAGVCLPLVAHALGRIPLLGVCLGHQVLVEACGGAVCRAPQPRHGKSSKVRHSGAGIFSGLPQPLEVGRYHSLVAEPVAGGPLQVIARSLDDDQVMAVHHPDARAWGLQFHPESVLTPHGMDILAGFLRCAGLAAPEAVPAPDRVGGGASGPHES